MRSIVKSFAAFGPIVCVLVACSSGSGGENAVTGASELIIPKCPPGQHLDCSGDGPKGQTICTCVQNETLYPLPVTVTGLTTQGLDLGLNAGPTGQGQGGGTVTANGSFTYQVPYGNYSVFVMTQPNGQACGVTNGVGYMTGTNTPTVEVTCGAAYTVGGTVSGLSSNYLELDFNATGVADGGFHVTGNGPYTAPITVTSGTAWTLSVFSQPTGQQCAVQNGSGTINGASVSDVNITCINLPCGGSGQHECIVGAACKPDATPNASDTCECNSGYVAQSDATCTACGAPGNPVCSGDICNSQNPPLVDYNGKCDFCGATGEPPCKVNNVPKCDPGTVLTSNGWCTTCGVSGYPPCTGNVCHSGLTAYGGTCQPCGNYQEPACSTGYPCQPGLVVSGQLCEEPSPGSSSGGSGSGSSGGGSCENVMCQINCEIVGCWTEGPYCNQAAAEAANQGCGVCCQSSCMNPVCASGTRPPRQY
jgi:hypothetical protein